MGRRCRAAVLVGALAASPSASAQVAASIDAGLSGVKYDGYLPSTATFVGPTVRVRRGGATLAARGSWLRFESGNESWQGSLAASVGTRLAGPFRGELGAEGGASRYAGLARFRHVLGQARVQLVGSKQGAWLGATGGATAFGLGERPVATVGAGWWGPRLGTNLAAAAMVTWVGDTSYTDFEAAARRTLGPLELEASLGGRVWSRGAGRGLFTEASAAFRVTTLATLIIAGGRYATDPVRGTIAGEYLTAALRLSAPRPTAAQLRFLPPRPLPPLHTVDLTAPVLADLSVLADRRCTIVVRAPGAGLVELMADFTDWQPVALDRAGAGLWTITLTVPAGRHRLNVRLDGGGWIVPLGVTEVVDEFGRAGTVVVP